MFVRVIPNNKGTKRHSSVTSWSPVAIRMGLHAIVSPSNLGSLTERISHI